MAEARTTIWDKLQTCGIVTIFSVLVWLYAEDRNVKDYTNEPVDVKFVAPAGQELRIEPGAAQRILVSVRGASGQYSQFQIATESAIELIVKADPGSEDAMQTVVLANLLSTHSKVVESGVSVLSTQPQTLPVRVEQLQSVRLPIAVDAGDLALVGAATVDPPEAQLKVPSSLAGRFSGRQLQVRLQEMPNLDGVPQNVPHTIESLTIRLPRDIEASDVRIEPATAKVTFTIQKRSREHTLTTVPVLLLLSPSMQRDYVVEINGQDQFLRDVKLSGPSDQIAAIIEGEVNVYAMLYLTSEDLDQPVRSKLPLIEKPDSIRVESTIPRVNFQIARRRLD